MGANFLGLKIVEKAPTLIAKQPRAACVRD